MTSSKLKKNKKRGEGGSGCECGSTDLPPPFVSSVKIEEREGEVKFYTSQPGLIAAAFSTITPKAIAEGKGC